VAVRKGLLNSPWYLLYCIFSQTWVPVNRWYTCLFHFSVKPTCSVFAEMQLKCASSGTPYPYPLTGQGGSMSVLKVTTCRVQRKS